MQEPLAIFSPEIKVEVIQIKQSRDFLCHDAFRDSSVYHLKYMW